MLLSQKRKTKKKNKKKQGKQRRKPKLFLHFFQLY
ncbi:hypothetical protein [Plasmodium yoelii yoelii]|uniref:Uncharacterized protein n=1 Tax=Plasmodium yoelii yoelii TaxID=73239 RepID=Q7RJZ2_PLAYO|nr:hypothetical protein [Plasmodium yoelii yoelii]